MFLLCYFAPMEGVTGAAFRSAHHRWFGGVDKYFTPFLSPTQHPRLTPRQLCEVAPRNNEGLNVVPQLLTRRAEDFIWAADALAHLGYPEINLNLGCPSGTVVAKGKGAGFLAFPEELDRFLDAVFSACTVKISVKTRLGVRDPAEFPRLLEIFNRYPVAELTIHPRVQKDFYRGTVRQEAFAAALAASRSPVCYNGDLVTAADCAAAETAYPAAHAIMIGRGLIANPALADRLKGGPAAEKPVLRAFHDDLYERYCTLFGSRHNAMLRMKEVWSFLLFLFEDSEKHGKRLRKAATPQDFDAQVDAVFRDLALREDAVPGWFHPA
ncbi:MAG: tRNA dihydrouridine synthase [Intestinibacillus sp.]